MEVVARKAELVGGMFGYVSEPAADPARVAPFWRPGDLAFLNARSAFHALLAASRPLTVWLPSFLCPVLSAVASAISRVRYYDPAILPSKCDSWLNDVVTGDCAVFIDYFGIPAPRAALAAATRQGACVVEDACQALLTHDVGQGADFALFSPRKFVGVIDGGILSARRQTPLPPIEWRAADDDWWQGTLRAAKERAAFDRGEGDRGWFQRQQRAEATAPVGPFAMSDLSRAALSGQFDWPAIAARRRANYRFLAERLPEFGLFRELEEGVVPLGFPALFDNRDQVRRKLFAEEIFPPIHWPIDSAVPADCRASRRLSACILTLPCDQRYDTATMERTAEIVKGAGRPCKDI